MKIDGSTILVTGGCSGLGAACVDRFISQGAKVLVADLAPPNNDVGLAYGKKALFAKVDVTKEAVSQWLKQSTFPRPDKLLKLAKLLDLDFNALVIRDEEDAPVVAFRRMKATKTRDHHVEKAQDIGRLLRQLVPYLPFDAFEVPPTLKDPVNDYAYLQQVAQKVRKRERARLQILDGARARSLPVAEIARVPGFHRRAAHTICCDRRACASAISINILTANP